MCVPFASRLVGAGLALVRARSGAPPACPSWAPQGYPAGHADLTVPPFACGSCSCDPAARSCELPARPSVRLEYERKKGAELCPGEASLRAHVAAQLGRDPFTPEGSWRVVASVARRGGGFVANMEVFENEGESLVSRADCRRRRLSEPVALQARRPIPRLNLGEPGAFDITPWADRVRLTEAQYTGVWELPVFGSSARSPLSPQENAAPPQDLWVHQRHSNSGP